MYSTAQYRIFGIDNDCYEIFDRAYRKDPYYLPLELPLPSSVQGFCICDEQSRAPAASFYCFPYTSTGRWQKMRVLRVTRLLLLPDKNRDDEKLVFHVMKEIESLGRRAGVRTIEAEVYTQIDSKIFFPSTTSVVNTYNTLEWKQVLINKGYTAYNATMCFELDVNDFADENLFDGIAIRNYRHGDEKDQHRYYNVWSLSDNSPYDFGHSGFWYRNVFGWPRAWYSEYPHLLNKDDYILFAEKNGEVQGFVHWWPNIYPLLIKGGRKCLYMSREQVCEKLKQIDEAKIFKMAVSRKAKNERDVIEQALICKAVELMKSKFGIRKCQIGNVPQERTPLKSFIVENGGKPVHEVYLMRKPIFPWSR